MEPEGTNTRKKKKSKRAMDFFKAIVSGVQLAKKQHETEKAALEPQAAEEDEQLQLAIALSRSNEEDSPPPAATIREIREGSRGERELFDVTDADHLLALRLHDESLVAQEYPHEVPFPIPPSALLPAQEEDDLAKALAESIKEEERRRSATEGKPSLRDSDLARMMQAEELRSVRGGSTDTPTSSTPPLRDSGLARQLADEELARKLEEDEHNTDPSRPSALEIQDRAREDLSNEEPILKKLAEQEAEKLERQREINRLESEERERIIREQNAAYEESLQADRTKEQQKREADTREREERARQEAEAELESAKDLSIQLSREVELQNRKKKWEELRKPDEKETTGICSLVIRLPNGERVQNKFFATDRIETVRAFVSIKLLEMGATYPLQYSIVSSYPYKKFSDATQTLIDSGLCPRALVNVEEERGEE